jgi:ABC-type transporter Mla maintaining outer membrane lipid asymmetry ATPase subunit MlaF
MTNAIETTGLVKHFGSTRALDGVDLRIRRGSVAAAVIVLVTSPIAMRLYGGER